jgi:hypothetical protein
MVNALREELRKRNYLPILFDFKLSARQNITETVTLLARMARFVMADLTDPSGTRRSSEQSSKRRSRRWKRFRKSSPSVPATSRRSMLWPRALLKHAVSEDDRGSLVKAFHALVH